VPDSAIEGLDLSSLRLAFDGAEPIDPATIEAFSRRFAPYGLREHALYPVYGLAECTLAVAFPPAGEHVHVDRVDRDALSAERRASPAWGDRDTAEHVSVGRALPGHTVRIRAVDGGEELGEREVGEICVSGPSCTRGYWGRPPRTSGEVRTGDLGYLADGQLYVIDRLKDLIIVAGRNYAPSDIERAAAGVEGVPQGGAVAFAVRGDEGTDELCVVVTIRPSTWRSCEQLQAHVERAVHARTALTPRHVIVVPPGRLPKTSSGKLRRQNCKMLWESGELRSARGVVRRAGIKVARLRQQLLRLVAGRRESDFPPPP
jgi:acyl-CoA synthetase (AMP-forming)/AMP-acid ligase II